MNKVENVKNVEGSIEILDTILEKGIDEDKIKYTLVFEYDPDGERNYDEIMQPIIEEVYAGLGLLDDEDEEDQEQEAFLCYMEAVRNVIRDAADKLDELTMNKRQAQREKELIKLLAELDQDIDGYELDDFEDD